MFDYEELTFESLVLTFDESKRAHQLMHASLIVADDNAKELYSDFVDACVSYANIRAIWATSSSKVRYEIDEKRTANHNLVLSSLDALDRYLTKRNIDTNWRSIIGKQHSGQERKRQGDFACYIAYIQGLAAR
ncbi:hypothetical protein [Companilactobacillus sp. HBUAS59699]|uniref:hypothetical protein n=1 Tax=Companilactobacillus sp. HBUAS59699 TaxID=3109358 RepID=UPI002FF36060